MTHSKPRYSIAEAQALLGLSRATLYVRAKEGRLQLHRDGSRAFITAAEMDRYLASCGGQAGNANAK
jgi:excisionase family DNA binding protein